MFLHALSLLNEEKKLIVQNMGFGAILDLTCSSNVNGIFHWLADQLDTQTGTLTLDNGFSFTITPSFVYKILGLPCGPMSVQFKCSKEDIDIIKEVTHTESPTAEHLCNLLNNDLLDDTSFSRVFMLLTLDAFIAPAGCGISSHSYYHNLIRVTDIPNLDWCSFALNWLLLCIKRFHKTKMHGIQEEIGGCKPILVVCFSYFCSFLFRCTS